jgi:hypothetical protein
MDTRMTMSPAMNRVKKDCFLITVTSSIVIYSDVIYSDYLGHCNRRDFPYQLLIRLCLALPAVYADDKTLRIGCQAP